jgi:hypothetical protein
MRRFLVGLGAACIVLLVSACGGGGGGEGGGGALSFSPSTLTANVAAGTSATLTVRATAADPSIFTGTVYIYIVDSQQVLSGGVELAQINTTTFSATLHSSATLGVGRHQGSFQVQLCKDANCAAQYPGSPVALPYDLNVAPGPLKATPGSSTSASLHWGGAAPADVSVTVNGPNATWSATTPASWLKVTSGTGTGGGSFSVGFVPLGLAVGEYTDTVTVRSADGQTVALPFKLTILPTQFVISGGVPTFTAINGTEIAPQDLSFSLDSGASSAWSASSPAAWLGLSPVQGTTTPATITLKPDSIRGDLQSGTHTTDIWLSSAGVVSKTVTTQLTLIAPTLSLSTQTITLGGPKGRDLVSPQSVTLSLNTGPNAWPWTLSQLPSWLSSSAQSGTVSQAGTPLAFSVNLANVVPGSATGHLRAWAMVNADGAGADLLVNLNADQHRLLVSEWGVGLASTPNGTLLSRTVQVSDNFGGTLAWSATSDSPWLTVTGSGSTGGSSGLTLSADPASLPSADVSYANVTVSSAAAGVSPAVIRVALWKDTNSAPAMTKLPLGYSNLAVDTIRPYVYVNSGGSDVDIYNAYTAQKMATVYGIGAALGQMSVAPDGGHLYVLDTAARSMAVVDLTTRMTTQWPLDKAVNAATTVLAIRPNGVEVVLVGDGTAYTAARSLGPTRLPDARAATPDGRYVFSLGGRYGIDYSAMSGGMLFVSFLNGLESDSGGNLRDVAINKQGTRSYEASGGGMNNVPGRYRCAVTDAVAGTLIGALPGGDAYPNNVEVTNDGRAICGISGAYVSSDFWVHSPAGALLQGYKVAGYARALKDGQMVVTPDGFVVVALTDDPLIAFVPIGP